jgi:hypothetical protein
LGGFGRGSGFSSSSDGGVMVFLAARCRKLKPFLASCLPLALWLPLCRASAGAALGAGYDSSTCRTASGGVQRTELATAAAARAMSHTERTRR